MLSPWIAWAIMVQRTAQARTLIDIDRATHEAKKLRGAMLEEVERLGLGFCERDEFQKYLEAT